MKIVGGVVGGLSALCTVLGFWSKYWSSDCCNGNTVPTVDNGVSNDGADDLISKDKTTPLQIENISLGALFVIVFFFQKEKIQLSENNFGTPT